MCHLRELTEKEYQGKAEHQLQEPGLRGNSLLSRSINILQVMQESKLYSSASSSILYSNLAQKSYIISSGFPPKQIDHIAGNVPDAWGKCHLDFSLCLQRGKGAKESTWECSWQWPWKVKEVKILKGQVYFQTSNWATSEIDPFLVISRKGVGREIHCTALPTDW